MFFFWGGGGTILPPQHFAVGHNDMYHDCMGHGYIGHDCTCHGYARRHCIVEPPSAFRRRGIYGPLLGRPRRVAVRHTNIGHNRVSQSLGVSPSACPPKRSLHRLMGLCRGEPRLAQPTNFCCTTARQFRGTIAHGRNRAGGRTAVGDTQQCSGAAGCGRIASVLICYN